MKRIRSKLNKLKFVSSRCTSWEQIKSLEPNRLTILSMWLYSLLHIWLRQFQDFIWRLQSNMLVNMHFQSSIISHHLINKYWIQLVEVCWAVVSVYSVYSGVEKFILLHFNEDAVFEMVVSSSITDQLDTLQFLPGTITKIDFITTLITSFHWNSHLQQDIHSHILSDSISSPCPHNTNKQIRTRIWNRLRFIWSPKNLEQLFLVRFGSSPSCYWKSFGSL